MKLTATLLASAGLALAATPGFAQEAEEDRTTYEVALVNIADGSEDRWAEVMETYVIPAHEAAGQTPPVVHWIMLNDDYDVMVINHRAGGMSRFDYHAQPGRDAFFEHMTEMVGGPEAMAAMGEEYDTIVEDVMVLQTHTHP